MALDPLNILERRFGHLAIPHLTRYIVAFNALVYMLSILEPGYIQWLTLDRNAILSGQVWRLLTFAFIPESMGPLWIIIALWFLLFIGESLEDIWGTFRFNLFYLCGIVGCAIAALVFGQMMTSSILNLTLLFAFATLCPNVTVLLFFVIPVKIKWIAWFAFFTVVVLGLLMLPLAGKAAIAASMLNYLLFFGPRFFRETRERTSTAQRRAKFQQTVAAAETLHRCHICGRTEQSNPELDFRVAADGEEYCTEHLPVQPK